MQRWIAAILAVLNTANGLAMLFASSIWWANVPGVPETGPLNLHFVQDVGAAFLVAGLALAARAWRPIYWPAAVAGSGFLAAHALIHLAMMRRVTITTRQRILPSSSCPQPWPFTRPFRTEENDMRKFIAPHAARIQQALRI